MLKRFLIILSVASLLAAGWLVGLAQEPQNDEPMMSDGINLSRAIFAGGCFWCMEPPFEKLPGVSAVVSGYTGGDEPNPNYKQVSAGRTGHTEAVEIVFDPQQVSYQQLLEVFWMQIDPTDAGGQFVDRGSQYRSGIYPLNEEQLRQAEASKREKQKLRRVRSQKPPKWRPSPRHR